MCAFKIPIVFKYAIKIATKYRQSIFESQILCSFVMILHCFHKFFPCGFLQSLSFGIAVCQSSNISSNPFDLTGYSHSDLTVAARLVITMAYTNRIVY